MAVISASGFGLWATHPRVQADDPCRCVDSTILDLVTTDVDLDRVPQHWRDHGFTLTPLDDQEVQAAYRHIIAGELREYSEPVLRDFLPKGIVLVRSIEFAGVSAMGTHASGCIWIAIESPQRQRYDERWIRAAVHREIAILLYYAAGGDFPRRDWIGGAPSPYKFENNPAEAIRAGASSTAFDLDLAKVGFLTEFAQSALVEDAATIHASYMMSRPLTCYLAKQYPEIGRKLKIWMHFVEENGLLLPCEDK